MKTVVKHLLEAPDDEEFSTPRSDSSRCPTLWLGAVIGVGSGLAYLLI